eukprot:6619311-Pyramimonas_sp.AAC.1
MWRVLRGRAEGLSERAAVGALQDARCCVEQGRIAVAIRQVESGRRLFFVYMNRQRRVLMDDFEPGFEQLLPHRYEFLKIIISVQTGGRVLKKPALYFKAHPLHVRLVHNIRPSAFPLQVLLDYVNAIQHAVGPTADVELAAPLLQRCQPNTQLLSRFLDREMVVILEILVLDMLGGSGQRAVPFPRLQMGQEHMTAQSLSKSKNININASWPVSKNEDEMLLSLSVVP